MKKVTLLIALMMIIAFTTYAEIAVTVTGSSELKLGVNLNDPLAVGFTNTNESKINFKIVSGSSEKGAEEAVYGWIKLSDWKLEFTSDKDAESWGDDSGNVEAKIMFPKGWVKISGTNNATNYVNVVQDDDADKDNADKGINSEVANSGGCVLGLNFAPIALEIGLFSENNWTQSGAATDATDDEYGWVDDDDDPTTAPVWDIVTPAEPAVPATDDLNDEFAFGGSLKATVDVAPLKIEAGVVLPFNYVADEEIGVGAKVSGTFGPLTVYAGTDMMFTSTEVLGIAITGTAMEFVGGVSLAVAGITLTADASMNSLSATAAGVTTTEELDGLDAKIVADASAMVPNLGLKLTVELYNLLGAVGDDADDAAEYAIGATLSYNLGKAKPYAEVRYGTFTASDNAYTYLADGNEAFKLNVGVEITAITNVSIKVDYNSDDIADDNGVLSVITKISL